MKRHKNIQSNPNENSSAITAFIKCVKYAACLSAFVFVGQTYASTETMETQVCPASFNSVKIPDNGKLCQVFAADYPASMILHVLKSRQRLLIFISNGQMHIRL